MCDFEATTRCRLTLKLNQEVREFTSTIGSQVQTIKTTFIIGPSITAAARIGLTTEPPSSSSSGSRTTPSPGVVSSTTNRPSGSGGTESLANGTAESQTSSSLSGAQIAGIVVAGFVVGLSAAAALIILGYRKRRKSRQQRSDGDAAGTNHDRKEMGGTGDCVEMGGGRHHAELDAKGDVVEMVGVELHHELIGGYEKHGISELQGSPPGGPLLEGEALVSPPVSPLVSPLFDRDGEENSGEKGEVKQVNGRF